MASRFVDVIEKKKDAAGRWRVTVSVDGGDWVVLKFNHNPTRSEIKAVLDDHDDKTARHELKLARRRQRIEALEAGDAP